MELKPLRVSEVNKYIKRIITGDPLLYNLSVEGEISNFKYHYSGHIYFTLKDDESKIKCVMFNNDCKNLLFRPEDGMKVIVTGYISVYEKDGSYQLYAKDMKTRGIGSLYIAYEKLKQSLEKEGLFDKSHKKPIPFLPSKIGVVTSSTGAAIRDIISVIKRRLPSVEIIIFPVLVQGDRAHAEICKGIYYFNKREDIDLIITGRGGGSIEELWAFNEEDVARAIYNSVKPIISAVGHETDFTIADFVSDLRAPTPSVAGEISVPRRDDLNYRLDDLFNRLEIAIQGRLIHWKKDLKIIKSRIMVHNPKTELNMRKQQLENLYNRMFDSINSKNRKLRSDLSILGSKLDVLSPLSVINRGYTIAMNHEGIAIKSVSSVKQDDILTLHISDGKVKVKVLNIIND